MQDVGRHAPISSSHAAVSVVCFSCHCVVICVMYHVCMMFHMSCAMRNVSCVMCRLFVRRLSNTIVSYVMCHVLVMVHCVKTSTYGPHGRLNSVWVYTHYKC